MLTILGNAHFNSSFPSEAILSHLPSHTFSSSYKPSLSERNHWIIKPEICESSLTPASLTSLESITKFWQLFHFFIAQICPLLSVTAIASHANFSNHHLLLSHTLLQPISHPAVQRALSKMQNWSPNCIYTHSFYSPLFSSSPALYANTMLKFLKWLPHGISNKLQTFRITDKTF